MVDMEVDINMEIPIGERVGHGGWLIGPKLFRFEACPACASSKFCEFIGFRDMAVYCIPASI